MSGCAKILDRLERVKQTGPGRWLARCPAHEDKSPSLSIRELEDGRILIHDFAGCQVGDVLAALGLSMANLFERPLAHSLPKTHSTIPARDILEALDHEITVAVLIVGDISRDRGGSFDQLQRLSQAAARIGAARDMVNPARLSAHA
jgi:hypothetical protein